MLLWGARAASRQLGLGVVQVRAGADERLGMAACGARRRTRVLSQQYWGPCGVAVATVAPARDTFAVRNVGS